MRQQRLGAVAGAADVVAVVRLLLDQAPLLVNLQRAAALQCLMLYQPPALLSLAGVRLMMAAHRLRLQRLQQEASQQMLQLAQLLVLGV